MPAPLSGPGVGLQIPQNLYPSELVNSPYDYGTNRVSLNAGIQLPVPAGNWFIDDGGYATIEYQDPVTGLWAPGVAPGWRGGIHYVKSDGFNVRVANRLGCPIGGVVNAPGSTYVQASTTISVTGGGGSTWLPIVGGQLSMNTTTIVTANAGANYGVPPIVIIPSPPPASNNANGVGGIQASGYATIASGTVSGFTFTNPGAGYTGTTFNVTCLANPTDPNLTSGITLATITFTVGSSGSLTGVLCTNPGNPLASHLSSANPPITLTVSGVGTNATVSPIMLETALGYSLTGGSTLGMLNGTMALLTSVGGVPNQSTFTNSAEFLYLAYRPRPCSIGVPMTGAGVIAATLTTANLYDGGLFCTGTFATGNSPVIPILVGTPLTASTGTVIGTSTLALTLGSRPCIVTFQPAP